MGDTEDALQQLPGQAPTRLPGRDLLVLYGSETGNSQDLAEDLGQCAERLHFSTTVQEMNEIDLHSLLAHGLAIFVVSTTGQGDMPQNAAKFWKSLLRKRLPPNCLGGLRYTTFGLGNSSYEKFNWAARKLHKRLDQLGAVQFQPAGEADEQHDQGIEGTYLAWKLELRTRLLDLYPLPESIQPIPDGVLLQPKFWLELDPTAMTHYPNEKAAYFCHPDTPHSEEAEHIHYRATQDVAALARYTESSHRSSSLGAAPVDTLDLLNQLKDKPSVYSVEDPANVDDFPPDLQLPIPNSWKATVVENDRVTPTSHWQDVRHLGLSVCEPNTGQDSLLTDPLRPGDTICLWPKNFPKDVQHLITMMGWEAVADLPVRFRQVRMEGSSYAIGDAGDVDIGYPPKDCYIRRGSTLRDILTHNFDITAIPKRSFFELMAANTSNSDHRARLLEFADLAHTDEFYDYTTRPRRSILEVLEEFPSVKLSWRDVARIFPVIRPRQFSIANSIRADIRRSDEHGEHFNLAADPPSFRVDLLIAIVKYKTVLRKTRRGLLSRYVESLPANTVIRVTVKRSPARSEVWPDKLLRPVLAIATGTGIAPIHAYFAERALEAAVAFDDLHLGETDLTHGRQKERDDFIQMYRQRKVEMAVKAQRAGMLTGGKSKFGPTGTAALQGQDGDASQKNMFGELVLFFGSRSKNADYYFKDDWVELGVRVFPAFSRDPIATASTPPSTEEPERRDNSLPIRTRSRADPAVAAEIADSNISTQPETAVPAPSVGLSSLLTGDSELLVKSGDKGESLDLVNKTLVRTEDRRHITVVRPKRYVQHVLLENYDVVCDLVKKGCRVMICGSRGRMPSEVKMALAECLVRRELARDIDHANSILSSMVEIWEEVW